MHGENMLICIIAILYTILGVGLMKLLAIYNSSNNLWDVAMSICVLIGWPIALGVCAFWNFKD